MSRVSKAVFSLSRRGLQVFGCLRRLFGANGAAVPPASRVTQREMVGHLAGIPHWERKIELADRYHYSKDEGLWIDKARPLIGDGETGRVAGATADVSGGFTRINYGCGGNLLDGWLNVDLFPSFAPNYRSVNLLDKHPFRDGTFEFAFSEDVLEHLNQAESIFFLSEIHRTLAPGGVLRLSFPGLEGVLARHYSPMSESAVRRGELEAYSFWDHIHFYSRAELDLVARHVGFTSVTFVEYGTSEHPELAGLDTRATQIGLNTYAELAK